MGSYRTSGPRTWSEGSFERESKSIMRFLSNKKLSPSKVAFSATEMENLEIDNRFKIIEKLHIELFSFGGSNAAARWCIYILTIHAVNAK